jgi:hypothetical protein
MGGGTDAGRQSEELKTTVSALVREALRERYLARRDEQMKAMQEFVGIRKGRPELLDAVEYVRKPSPG